MWRVGVVVRRYINILIIIINFPYSTCSRSFFGSNILTSLFIFKCFFGLVVYSATRLQPKRTRPCFVLIVMKKENNYIIIKLK